MKTLDQHNFVINGCAFKHSSFEKCKVDQLVISCP